jgi:Ethanolamine utilization protein EutJ (predicted chaperonin)
MWTCFALLFLCTTAFAQTLEVTPVTVDRGSANILRIVLKSRAGKPLAALQWDLVYREGLRIEPSGVVAGAASETAGKSVTCARKPSDGANNRLACILAGGVQALSAGVIAIVRFEAAKDTSPGEKIVGLEKAVGVSPALEPIPIENIKALITIR